MIDCQVWNAPRFRCTFPLSPMRITSSSALVASMQFGISGPLDCHVYALRGPAGIVLIDAGSGTHYETLLANLLFDLATDKIESLIVTHGHLDHCGGAASIAEKTHCKVLTTESTRPILERADEEASGLRLARNQGGYPPDFRFSPCKVGQVAKDGVEFEAGGLRWK